MMKSVSWKFMLNGKVIWIFQRESIESKEVDAPFIYQVMTMKD